MKKTIQNPDHIWIVKASESLMGPYTIADLAVAVRTKQVGLLDEAKSPNSRWMFIRNLPELQTAVLELANESETIEKTFTSAHTQVSVTRRIDDGMTPTPTPILPPQAKPTLTHPTAKPHIQSEVKVKTYGTQAPAAKIPIGKWLLSAVFAVSFLLAVFAFFQKQNWQNQQKKTWTQIQQLYAAKLYERAFQSFKDYQLETPEQPLALMRLGFLHLIQGRELVKAKRFFDKSVQLDPNNKELMLQNLNGLALYSLYDGDTSVARNYLEKALTLEPSNIATKINQIAVYMSRSNWSEALKLAQQISVQEPRKSYLIQAILVELSGKFKDEVPNLLSALKSTSDNSSYLKAEMKLMRLRLASTSGSAAEVQQALDDFFMELPVFAMQFSEDPVIDQRWKDWNFLFQFCSEFNTILDRSPEAVAIQVVCMAKVQRWTEAEKILAEGLVRFPNNSRILLSQLHLLSSMQRWPEVRALKRLPTLVQEESSHYYFAKGCLEEKQEACVESYLGPMLQKNKVKTFVYELKAKLSCRDGSSESCRFVIGQGLAQDPLSTELLNIRYDIEEAL